MKVVNAFVHIALVAPMLVAAYPVDNTDNKADPYYPSSSGKGYYPSSSGKGYYPSSSGKGYYPSSKGKGSKSKGSSKGKGTKSTKSKGYHSKGGYGCKWYKVVLRGFQEPATFSFPAVPPANPNTPGQSFIYNSDIWANPTLNTPANIYVSGDCVRFQAATTNPEVAGAGSCDFTYTVELDHLVGTFEVSGELFDQVASTMAITGGTEIFVGAAGQVEYLPNYAPGATSFDVFDDALYYNMTAHILIYLCPHGHNYPPYYHYY
jgi:hypothetical protein